MTVISLVKYFFLLTFCTGHVSSLSKTIEPIITYIYQEQTNVNAHSNDIREYLSKKKIPLGLQPRSLKTVNPLRITKIIISPEGKQVECRVSLSKAPVGRQ